ncbi:MAG: SDR family oxidoreductase [Kosmotoga sp.]|nr:MAG: SDR family oxidoreductase [Kosmotoga sp.]
MERFKDKVVLITGGASGIGKATAEAFLKEGAIVIATDVNENKGKQLLEDYRSLGTIKYMNLDVTKPQEHRKVVEDVVNEFGKLDIAFNNAGIGGAMKKIHEYPVEEWGKVISVNLLGVFYGMKYQIEQMKKQIDGGVIINNSSILGKVGFENVSAYVTAKHGVIGLTKSAAIEYSSEGIRINAVNPAFIKTPMIDENLDEEMQKALVNMHPVKRLGKPEEVAKSVLFLASDESSFITGTGLMVDGGYTAQ